jgi:hypothetical protein
VGIIALIMKQIYALHHHHHLIQPLPDRRAD